MEDSIFTKIINGEIPSYTIYEDDRVIAILDVHPLNPGHTLVIPKIQIDHIWDLDDDTYSYVWEVSRKLASHIHSVLQPKRVGIVVEGFGVPHTHIHLIPINRGDELKKPQDMTGAIDHDTLAGLAEKLRFS